MEKISGLISAPYTPFHPDGGLHLEVIDSLVERAAATGLAGVFPCGTTGEFPSLTLEERRQVSERWVQGAAGRFRVIVHAGGPCLGDSKELAVHAGSVGADGIAMIGPYFFRPTTVEETGARSIVTCHGDASELDAYLRSHGYSVAPLPRA